MESFIKRLNKVITDVEQIVTDIDSWNDHNPNETPLDHEDLRMALVKAKNTRCLWASGHKDQAMKEFELVISALQD